MCVCVCVTVVGCLGESERFRFGESESELLLARSALFRHQSEITNLVVALFHCAGSATKRLKAGGAEGGARLQVKRWAEKNMEREDVEESLGRERKNWEGLRRSGQRQGEREEKERNLHNAFGDESFTNAENHVGVGWRDLRTKSAQNSKQRKQRKSSETKSGGS